MNQFPIYPKLLFFRRQNLPPAVPGPAADPRMDTGAP